MEKVADCPERSQSTNIPCIFAELPNVYREPDKEWIIGRHNIHKTNRNFPVHRAIRFMEEENTPNGKSAVLDVHSGTSVFAAYLDIPFQANIFDHLQRTATILRRPPTPALYMGNPWIRDTPDPHPHVRRTLQRMTDAVTSSAFRTFAFPNVYDPLNPTFDPFARWQIFWRVQQTSSLPPPPSLPPPQSSLLSNIVNPFRSSSRGRRRDDQDVDARGRDLSRQRDGQSRNKASSRSRSSQGPATKRRR